MPSNAEVIDLTGSPSPGPPVISKSRPARAASTNGILGRTSNFNPRMGAKRLVIKNLRATPRVSPKDYADRTWGHLDEALTTIFAGQKIQHSLEELYRGVENICRQDGAPELFEKLQTRVQQYLESKISDPSSSNVAQPMIDRKAREHVQLLVQLHAAWLDWNAKLLLIRSIFFYLDRSFLLPSRTHPTINEMGEKLFRDQVFSDDNVMGTKAVLGMLILFGEERKFHGAAREPELLKASIGMVHDLKVYSRVFEPGFLDDSRIFFEVKAEELTAMQDLAVYVRQSDRLRTDELARCGFFDLDSRTRRDLVTFMDAWLVKHRVEVLTHADDIAKLIDANDVESLEKVYSLLQRVDRHAKLRGPWERYIRRSGTAIVLDEDREGVMVVRLLELKTKLDNVWRTSFHKHEELGHVLRESFASFINEKSRRDSKGGSNSKPGEMIAKYVDMLLRGGVKAIPTTLVSATGEKRLPSALSSIGVGKDFGAEEEDVDMLGGDDDAELGRQLDQVLDLFRFIEGKDVFEAFYKKDLARRLLMARSASADAERNMLARLKNECGAGFTHNLEQMFKDVDLARDEMASYKATRADRHRHSKRAPLLDLNVNVLSAAAWPTYADIPVTIPDEISRAIADYDVHYKSKHTGRRLTWKHSLAHCVLRAHFPKGNKELVVSSFQAIVLLLFNDLPSSDTLTYADLQAATALSDVELTRTLQSLACAKHRVLRKTPAGRDIDPATDVFAYNAAFASPLTRIKINQIQLRETRADTLATMDDVHRDRQYETQAAIVRIMKALGPEGEISFAELQAETIRATRKRGALAAGEIKGQVEKLIEKEYMERGGGGRFRYIA